MRGPDRARCLAGPSHVAHVADRSFPDESGGGAALPLAAPDFRPGLAGRRSLARDGERDGELFNAADKKKALRRAKASPCYFGHCSRRAKITGRDRTDDSLGLVALVCSSVPSRSGAATCGRPGVVGRTLDRSPARPPALSPKQAAAVEGEVGEAVAVASAASQLASAAAS
ncbi:hypothetical protein Mp_1g03940 [Marchantia polymorpha subsp. ruderalis]|uniref:Uncharacterized protein n=2 Tax=Marchantia polymorpha TaxID=3197 RepID=A0AAF6AL98_MARPO|nr:hypothetical protein MARPO_0005s0213 [Marchantia polymorpha]BBM97218.1 hypothetical protein Mp_1g03940 [Marchantia polymorpha subsp. ruderalis]|eukprot:PTQ48589.1 hypothetical protein MARPO_0005s0213 [Marchantia polymorpha]